MRFVFCIHRSSAICPALEIPISSFSPPLIQFCVECWDQIFDRIKPQTDTIQNIVTKVIIIQYITQKILYIHLISTTTSHSHMQLCGEWGLFLFYTDKIVISIEYFHTILSIIDQCNIILQNHVRIAYSSHPSRLSISLPELFLRNLSYNLQVH